jgi:hypothetical protein
MSPDDILLELINSLSFEGYVLINCLNLVPKQQSNYLTPLLTFVAYNKQGFFNIFKELTTMYLRNDLFGEKYFLRLFNNQIIFRKDIFIYAIKYVVDETHLKEIVNSPGLDFYKCYYDGVKMYCTPEAIQCHKTGIV